MTILKSSDKKVQRKGSWEIGPHHAISKLSILAANNAESMGKRGERRSGGKR